MNKFKELYEYRYMLVTLIKQDLLGKYKRSVLGIFWVLINPLLQLLIYTVLFKYIFKVDIENYSIYLFIALMGWNLFSNSLTQGCSIIVKSADLIKSVYFPKELLPMAKLIGNVINYILSFPIIIIGLFISKIGLSHYILLLPVLLIIQFIFTYSITIMLSMLNVFIRDIEQMISSVLFIWMYATPIVYSSEMIPSNLKIIFNLNPMLHIINAYRDILYYKQCFDLGSVAIVLIVSILFLIIAELLFNKLSKKFAEEL